MRNLSGLVAEMCYGSVLTNETPRSIWTRYLNSPKYLSENSQKNVSMSDKFSKFLEKSSNYIESYRIFV